MEEERPSVALQLQVSDLIWPLCGGRIGFGSAEPRGLDAAGTLREPIRKAIDQFPLISQLVSTSLLQSKTRQLSRSDKGLDGFQTLEPPKKWIHVREGTVCLQHHMVLYSVLAILHCDCNHGCKNKQLFKLFSLVLTACSLKHRNKILVQ